jgi:solute carrier family 35 (UDP-galactose transporter), member B1
MARTKSKPVERQPSSEYVTRQTSTPFQRKGEAMQGPSGLANGAGKPAPTAAQEEAGVTQLIIAVAGIYGSL